MPHLNFLSGCPEILPLALNNMSIPLRGSWGLYKRLSIPATNDAAMRKVDINETLI